MKLIQKRLDILNATLNDINYLFGKLYIIIDNLVHNWNDGRMVANCMNYYKKKIFQHVQEEKIVLNRLSVIVKKRWLIHTLKALFTLRG